MGEHFIIQQILTLQTACRIGEEFILREKNGITELREEYYSI